MYVKRALIAALEPPFYRDGLLPHTRAVSHVGEPLQQSAAALDSHYGRPLQHCAAARPCAAAFIHTTVDRCSTGDSHPGAPLQQTAAAYQFDILFFSPQHTAIAGCCSTLKKKAQRNKILSLAHRCSACARAFLICWGRLLQHL